MVQIRTLVVAVLTMALAACGSSLTPDREPGDALTMTSTEDSAGQNGETSPGAESLVVPSWSAPPEYEFTLASSCGERALIGRFRVSVEDGAVVDAEGLDESGRAFFQHGFGDEVPTLTELLEEASAARERGADLVDVQANDDGRPSSIDIDWNANAVDDEACYDISDYSERS